MMQLETPINDIDVASFWRDGFLVRKSLADADTCAKLLAVADEHLQQQMAPIEYEVDVRYPGAPDDLYSAGADTSRRLLQAYSRHPDCREWARQSLIYLILSGLFGRSDIRLSQCHHNCFMTKQPGYSSVTRWHQDNRYWSFDEENLISVWLALGNEYKRNGCLRVIPGSHKEDLPGGRFDAELFLRTDLAANKLLLNRAVSIELQSGDALFFHSRLLHAAGRNLTDSTKFSLVFTYHEASNRPIENTRSARFPSIKVKRGRSKVPE